MGTGEKGRRTFGRLLLFWRNTLEMTQEELAWKVGASSRHLGFLETGRSQPRRAMVLRLANALHLNPRDTNNMLIGAGFMPSHEGGPLPLPEHDFLHQTLLTTLRHKDPHPTVAMDPYTSILMLNKAFLRLLYDYVEPALFQVPLNGYHLLFSEKCFCPYLPHWEELACLQLMALQQEIIITEDPTAEKILQGLLAYPNVPANWRRRVVELGESGLSFKNSFILRHGYQFPLRQPAGPDRKYLAVMTTVGSAASIQPRILMFTLYPEGDSPYVTAEELSADRRLKHPLLFY